MTDARFVPKFSGDLNHMIARLREPYYDHIRSC